MGIDARMFVRIKGKDKWKTEDEVRRLAFEIGSTFNSGTFWQVSPGDSIWPEGRRALEIIKPATAKMIEEYELDPDHAGKVIWTQDGDPIIGDDDEQFIEVNLYGRYYGAGYERGDWAIYRSVIQWLNIRLPDAQVWYGGDSSGVCAEHASTDYLAEMDEHWSRVGGRPYGAGFSNIFAGGITAPTCTSCEEPMISNGGGGDRVFFFCQGCDEKGTHHKKFGYAKADRGMGNPDFADDGTVIQKKNIFG